MNQDQDQDEYGQIWTNTDKKRQIWTRFTAQLVQTNNWKSAGSVSFSGFGSGTITGSASSKSPEVDLEVIPVDPEVEVEVEAGFACLTSGYLEVQLHSRPSSGVVVV